MPRDSSVPPPTIPPPSAAAERQRSGYGISLRHAIPTIAVILMMEGLLFYAMILPLVDGDGPRMVETLDRLSPFLGAHALSIAIVAGSVLLAGVISDLLTESPPVAAVWPDFVRRLNAWRAPYRFWLFIPAFCVTIVFVTAHCRLLLPH